MAIKDRSGGRNWIPGLFAAFWILLAVFSAAYLFRIVTEPQAQRAESAVASPATTAATSAAPAPSSAPSALSEQQAEALIQASEAKDKEIGELRAAVQDLSGQVTALSSRLKPLERVLGPVAALPSSTSVTTSPPSPEPNTPIARPPELPKPSVSAAPPTPPSVTVDEPSDAAKADRAGKASAQKHASLLRQVKPQPRRGPAIHRRRTRMAEIRQARRRRTILTPSRTPARRRPLRSRRLLPFRQAPRASASRSAASASRRRSSRCGVAFSTNHAALVAGLQPRRVMAPDKKWRLIAGPFSSAAEAMQACGLFKKADMPCEATVYAGDAF